MGTLKARANLNGGELDCEHTSQRDQRRATLKGRNLKRRGSEPGPTSMVESWTRTHSSKQRKNPGPTHRVVSSGGKSIITFKTIEGRITKCNAQIPDRPQWRRAGARAFSTKGGKGSQDTLQDQPQWRRSGAVTPSCPCLCL